MVKITLVTNEPRVTDIVSEDMTVRDFLDEHGTNYGLGTTSLDGVPLDTEGLDTTFADHGVTDRAVLSVAAWKNNGAQAYIMGSSCVVKSRLTPDQIRKVKKYHPEKLCLYDENGEMDFKIDLDETSPGTIGKYGACFGNATSPEGNATITVVIDPAVEDSVELIRDKLGHALTCLKKMEEQILEALPVIEQEDQDVRSMITRI